MILFPCVREVSDSLTSGHDTMLNSLPSRPEMSKPDKDDSFKSNHPIEEKDQTDRLKQMSSSLIRNGSIEQRCVQFKDVDVFYFERTQGFVCVPSQGGSTLGMSDKHSTHETLSVCEHQATKKLIQYATLLKRHKTGKISLTPVQYRFVKRYLSNSPKLVRDRLFVGTNGMVEHKLPSQLDQSHSHTTNSEDLTIIDKPECCSPAANSNNSYNEFSVTRDEELEAQLENIIECCFLQLQSIKKRRFLLRRSGLTAIDPSERAECQAIRSSREACGCTCPDGNCLPDRCSCAIEGIKCQVDRTLFPCSCTLAPLCENPIGRIEFDPMRVRAHYLHTRMRVDMQRLVGCEVSTSSAELSQADEPLRLAKRSRLDVGDDSCQFAKPTDAAVDCNVQVAHEAETTHCSPTSSLSHPFDPNTDNDPDHEGGLFNTTRTGACRDCCNDLFVQNLLHEHAKLQTEAMATAFHVSPSEVIETGTQQQQPSFQDLTVSATESVACDLVPHVMHECTNSYELGLTSNVESHQVEELRTDITNGSFSEPAVTPAFMHQSLSPAEQMPLAPTMFSNSFVPVADQSLVMYDSFLTSPPLYASITQPMVFPISLNRLTNASISTDVSPIIRSPLEPITSILPPPVMHPLKQPIDHSLTIATNGIVFPIPSSNTADVPSTPLSASTGFDADQLSSTELNEMCEDVPLNVSRATSPLVVEGARS